jgi:uncharacterized membrane protein YgdD (TMEM256/DUF423 family)
LGLFLFRTKTNTDCLIGYKTGKMKNQTILLTGAVFMALAVLLGAFGAHALKTSLTPEMLAVYKTGVEYQFYHALGLLLIGVTGFHIDSKWLRRSGLLLTIGILLFSGSLYVLALTGIKVIGAVTPIGGVSFVAGWVCLAVGILKH